MSELRERIDLDLPQIEAVLMLDSSRTNTESDDPMPREIVVCSWTTSEQSARDLSWLAMLNKSAKRRSADALGSEETDPRDVRSSGEQELIRTLTERESARQRWRLSRERILFFSELGLLFGIFGLGLIIILGSQSWILQVSTLTGLLALARLIVRHLTGSVRGSMRSVD